MSCPLCFHMLISHLFTSVHLHCYPHSPRHHQFSLYCKYPHLSLANRDFCTNASLIKSQPCVKPFSDIFYSLFSTGSCPFSALLCTSEGTDYITGTPLASDFPLKMVYFSLHLGWSPQSMTLTVIRKALYHLTIHPGHSSCLFSCLWLWWFPFSSLKTPSPSYLLGFIHLIPSDWTSLPLHLSRPCSSRMSQL